MPQPPRDDRRIDAFGQGDARVGVAQAMERDRRQRRGSYETSKEGTDAFRVELLAVYFGEDELGDPAADYTKKLLADTPTI